MMSMMHKLKILIILTLLIFPVVTVPSMEMNGGIVANWTVMYYICGEKGDMDIYADLLIENLSRIGSGPNFNLVALFDGPGYNDSAILYFDKNGRTIRLNDVLGWPSEVDMSSSITFEMFCKNIMLTFPSKHYAFVTFATGGTGWKWYAFNDMEGRGLNLSDFAESLKRITCDGSRKLDVLFTSCCMSSIELSYEICPYVRYLVTTQEHIAGYDLVKRYYQPIWVLKNNSYLSPEDFAKLSVEIYELITFEYFTSYGYKISPLTKMLNKLPFRGLHTVIMNSSAVAINLSRVPSLVREVDNLSIFLILYAHDEKMRDEVKLARDEAKEFGKAWPKLWENTLLKIVYARFPIYMLSYNCRIDLYDFVRRLKEYSDNGKLREICEGVMNKINSSVILIKRIEEDISYGFNIFFPETDVMYKIHSTHNGDPISRYEDLRFSKDIRWDEFLRIYLSHKTILTQCPRD
ncbi:MAG: hypothetical protein FE042_04200 [Thermoplasmata archaeon]|nr:MAG: hypothetical protein FE042_04200 [Thermoplasmata archaeon]